VRRLPCRERPPATSRRLASRSVHYATKRVPSECCRPRLLPPSLRRAAPACCQIPLPLIKHKHRRLGGAARRPRLLSDTLTLHRWPSPEPSSLPRRCRIASPAFDLTAHPKRILYEYCIDLTHVRAIGAIGRQGRGRFPPSTAAPLLNLPPIRPQPAGERQVPAVHRCPSGFSLLSFSEAFPKIRL